MACPHLEYRREAGDQSFETERAYCTVADRFVQPMRADICTERYGLDPASDCEIYREAAELAWDDPPDAAESTTDAEEADAESNDSETNATVDDSEANASVDGPATGDDE